MWFATFSSFPSRDQRQGVRKTASHIQHQSEIWARPVVFNSSQQQYKHLPKPWAQPCLRDDLKGEACADILSCSFHARDCLLASGPCSAPGTTCATLWLSPQPNQSGKYTVARAPPAKLKPNQENRQAGSSCSAAKGWETPKQWSHGWVCSQFPLHCLGKADLLMGQGNPSPGHTDDISHGSATPGGHSGLAQA